MFLSNNWCELSLNYHREREHCLRPMQALLVGETDLHCIVVFPHLLVKSHANQTEENQREGAMSYGYGYQFHVSHNRVMIY